VSHKKLTMFVPILDALCGTVLVTAWWPLAWAGSHATGRRSPHGTSPDRAVNIGQMTSLEAVTATRLARSKAARAGTTGALMLIRTRPTRADLAGPVAYVS